MGSRDEQHEWVESIVKVVAVSFLERVLFS